MFKMRPLGRAQPMTKYVYTYHYNKSKIIIK